MVSVGEGIRVGQIKASGKSVSGARIMDLSGGLLGKILEYCEI